MLFLWSGLRIQYNGSNPEDELSDSVVRLAKSAPVCHQFPAFKCCCDSLTRSKRRRINYCSLARSCRERSTNREFVMIVTCLAESGRDSNGD